MGCRRPSQAGSFAASKFGKWTPVVDRKLTPEMLIDTSLPGNVAALGATPHVVNSSALPSRFLLNFLGEPPLRVQPVELPENILSVLGFSSADDQ